MNFDNYNEKQLQKLLDSMPNEFYAVNNEKRNIERIEKNEMSWDMGDEPQIWISGVSVDGTKRSCQYREQSLEWHLKFTDFCPNFNTYEEASNYLMNTLSLNGEINGETFQKYRDDFNQLVKDIPSIFV